MRRTRRECRRDIATTPIEPSFYALIVNGKVLGIVEAKKLTLGPQNVLTQVERYSKGVADGPINRNGYRVPFLYSTSKEGQG